jgi:hypothetical protein
LCRPLVLFHCRCYAFPDGCPPCKRGRTVDDQDGVRMVARSKDTQGAGITFSLGISDDVDPVAVRPRWWKDRVKRRSCTCR